MKNLSYCRRTFISCFAILCLTALAAYKGTDVSAPIAAIAMGLAGANAYEKASMAKQEKRYKE